MSAAAAAADTAGGRLPATPPSGRRVEGHDERPSHAAANATGPPLPVQERSWYGLSSDTLFRLIEPVELLEDPHLLVNGYAETLVGDGEPDVAVRPLERHADTTSFG